MLRLTGLTVLLALFVADPCRAGFQVRATVCRLSAESWQLEAQGERVFLVDQVKEVARDDRRWRKEGRGYRVDQTNGPQSWR